MPGLITSASMPDQSIVNGSAIRAPASAAASREAALSSQAMQSIPAALRARTVARPERASPSTTNDEPWRTARSIIRYLSFRVARPAIARMAAMIQKRKTMVGSAHPFCSK